FTSGSDVLDQHRAGRGPVALPQLVAACSVVGDEKKRAVDVGQGGWAGAMGTVGAGAGPNVLDEHSADSRAVALPQLQPADSVVGREEQGSIHVGQGVGGGAGSSGEDILDQRGAGGRTIALP